MWRSLASAVKTSSSMLLQSDVPTVNSCLAVATEVKTDMKQADPETLVITLKVVVQATCVVN